MSFPPNEMGFIWSISGRSFVVINFPHRVHFPFCNLRHLETRLLHDEYFGFRIDQYASSPS